MEYLLDAMHIDTSKIYGAGPFALCYFILLIVAWVQIFNKAGESGWKALIPIYNLIVLFRITWGSGWFFLLTLIPIVGAIVNGIITPIKLAHCFGRGTLFAILSIFFTPITTLILGLGGDDYLGSD